MSAFRSDFRESFRARTIATLSCPRCPAVNRPGATYIEMDQTGSRAYCAVCSAEGPLEKFQAKESV